MHINKLAKVIHENALEKGFYDKIYEILENADKSKHKTYKNLFTCQQLLLIISELGEATEGLRKGDYLNFNEEIADACIRLFDLSSYLNINLEYEIKKKMVINEDRPPLHNKQF